MALVMMMLMLATMTTKTATMITMTVTMTRMVMLMAIPHNTRVKGKRDIGGEVEQLESPACDTLVLCRTSSL